jgi:proteic killer suppression protein
VKIRNFAHKGLERLYEEDDSKGLPPSAVDKLRKMMVFLEAMDEAGELRTVKCGKPTF